MCLRFIHSQLLKPPPNVKNMKFRPYEEADLESILELANRQNRNAHEFVPLTSKSLQVWIEDSKPLIIVADDNGIKGFAIGERGWPGEPDEIEISMLCVDPDNNADSMEKRLLDASESISEANGIVTMIPIGDPRITQQEEWGFQLDGGLLQLTRSLVEMPPQPPIMEGARIRSLKKGEEEEFVRLLNTSYARPRLTLKDLDAWHRDDPLFKYDRIQVVEYQGRLIGGGVSRADVEYNEHYHKKRGYLGPSGTLPEFRGRGLNRAVNWHAMKSAKEHGMDSVSLYTNEENFPVLKLTYELGYTLVYHWKLLKRRKTAENQRKS